MEEHIMNAVKQLVKDMQDGEESSEANSGEQKHGDNTNRQVDEHIDNRKDAGDSISSTQSDSLNKAHSDDRTQQTDRSSQGIQGNDGSSPFEQVKKELEILNTESQPRLYTGPYGRIQSPFKKFSSFRTCSRGVKRSPRKLPLPRSKKVKLLSDFDLLADSSSESEVEESTSPEPEKITDEPLVVAGPSSKPDLPAHLTDNEHEDSDSGDNQWQIIEDSDTEIDRKLDEKSSKFSLSAINVKSIIHKIVTNEKVVEMVRRAVLEQVEEQQLEYEPKMTRSKAKEVLETHGDIPLPYGLSPRKTTHDESKFVDIDLPEDEEDDEDFNPFKVIDPPGSEDDSESVLSSGFSDCETLSMPSTPTTPTDGAGLAVRNLSTPTNGDNENSGSFLSPMGPPLQSFVPRSHHKSSTNLGQRYRDAIEQDEKAKREEEELIASRTRSKCPLKEVSLFDIEANFVAPDITEDLYDTACDDEDWNNFLKTLIVFNTDVNVNEDTNEATAEEEDPEFNFLEEAENDSYDREDFRNDRGVRVSKKELNLLMNELNEAYNECDPIDINVKNMIKAQSETIAVAQTQKKSSYNPLVHEVLESERRQIADQLRKHVQLLAQTFVLGMGDMEEHKHSIDAAKMFLSELKNFSEVSEKQFPNTLLKVCNLPAALEVMSDSIWTDAVEHAPGDRDRLDSLVFKFENQRLPSLNYKQLKVLWTSPAFMYPELLPRGGFFKLTELKKDRSRVKFIEAEDNLLAMGLDQFQHLPNGKEYIHNFMLPSKTKKQIQIRVKNLSTKTAKNNAVKYWKEHKRLPDFPQSAPYFNPCLMKACKDRTISILEFPAWAVFFRPEDAADLKKHMDDSARLNSYFGATVNPLERSQIFLYGGSAPVTPDQSAGSSNVTSSSSSGSSSNNSKAGLNKTKRLPRKKLNLDKGKKTPIPAFIPLTFSGKVKSITPSLTTSCLLDKNVTSSSTTGPSISPGVSVSTISTSTVSGVLSLPSLIVIGNSVQVQSAGPSSNNGGSSNTGLSSVTSAGEINTSQSAGGESVGLNSLNVNAVITSDSVINRTTMSIQDVSSTSVTNDTLSHPSLQQNTLPFSSNYSPVSMPVLTSPVSTPTRSGTTTSLNSNNNSVQRVGVIPVDSSPACSDRSTPQPDDLAYTPDRFSNSSTPTRGSIMSPSSGGESPKNALEIIASYAPYLLSPSPNRNHQKVLETTPKKRSGFIKLAPKPTPPGSNPSPSVSIRVPKVKSSPRRQRLNEQAKAILPKGFVVRSIDVSPSKKVASSLIEKAKYPGRKSKSQSFYFGSSSGYCKILPHPESPNKHEINSVNSIRPNNGNHSRKHFKKDPSLKSVNKSNTSDRSTKTSANKCDENKENIDTHMRDKSDGLSEPDDGQTVDNDLDDDEDKTVDTESDYTQSEDGNDTQEDVDSQEEIDSQEDDDNHIANLMQASTTTRFDPSKEDVSKSHLGKKDRDRDTTLAMLAPDVITSDPQRDMRDTAYAQAYLHKVKKALREDMDKLETFLHLMYNFSKTKESPVELYLELRSLFKDHPGLIHDFAGFLLQDQAVECGCYDAFEEFNSARSFLRKLELYFSKTPYHFQRIIKSFSRWYRKPGRSTKDLKNEIEPMLKGHKYLLEEFSKFFPTEQPPDSMMDDFEEMQLEGSDDELKYDSFEEIELFGGEEVLGTKRCTCLCHESKDDIFRKKKRHCYRCCLTVIDGELVYRVNKSTIKKINITFGPSLKASSILTSDTDEGMASETGKPTDLTEVVKQTDMDTETENQSEGAEELMQIDREPADLDSGCVVDSDGLEKEVLMDGSMIGGETGNTEKVKSPDTDTQKQVSRNIVTEAVSLPSDFLDTTQVSAPSSMINATTEQNVIEMSSIAISTVTSTGVSSCLTVVSSSRATTIKTAPPLEMSVVLSSDKVVINEPIDQSKTADRVLDDSVQVCQNSDSTKSSENSESGLNTVNRAVSDTSNSSKSSSETALANDILAAAFNAALMSEVSIDSVFPFPLATKSNQGKPTKGVCVEIEQGMIEQSSEPSATSDKDSLTCKPVALQDSSRSQTVNDHPSGQSQLSISSNSSFTKVITAALVDSVEEAEPKIQFSDFDSSSQPFSPFSPFGQEIQSITSAKNIAPIKVPSKIRRITPIPVRVSSEDDQSFQSVVQNSPVITDMIQSPLAQMLGDKCAGDSNSSHAKQAQSEGTQESISVPFTDFGSNSNKSVEMSSRKSADAVSLSQKSDSSEKSSSAGNAGDIAMFSALKISQPNLFSEDANVAFTRTCELTSMTSTISDDSLLQCLVKPSHFNDTIGTVSNLTNILNALDEKSSHGKGLESHETLGNGAEKEEHNSSTNLTKNIPTGFSIENTIQPPKHHMTFKGESKQLLTENSKISHLGNTENKTVSPGKVVESSDSSDSINNKDSQYFPQTIQSIENLDRINTGLFKVTSLSDSESSGVPTPCNSATQVITSSNTLQQGQVTVTNTQILKSAQTSDTHINVNNKDLHSTKVGVQEQDKSTILPDRHVNNSETCSTKQSENRNTPNVQSTDKVHNSNDSAMCSDVEGGTSLNNETKSQVISNDNSSVNQTELPDDESLNKEKGKKKKKKKREEGESNSSSHKKKKKRSKEKKLDEVVAGSPDVSSQDSESGIKHLQPQDSELTVEQLHLQQKDFSTSLTVSVGTESGSEHSPTGSVLSPGLMSSGPPSVQSQGSLHSPAPSNCSSTGVGDEEPIWTKETDRIILEKCKAHGVKEKTFVRIAKRLGDVTSKQVRKRFSHLYQLIFGAQSAEGGQETSSSNT